MTAPSNPSELFSPFLPTTYNIPEEEDRVDVFLQDTFAQVSDVVNDKTIGTFVQSAQNFSGEKWWYKNPKITRNGYQVISWIESFPNAGTMTLDAESDPPYPILDVQPEFVVTHVWGSASLPCDSPDNTVAGTGDYFSFYGEGNSKINFTMSNKQIVITTTVDMSGYSGFIVIQYLRNGT